MEVVCHPTDVGHGCEIDFGQRNMVGNDSESVPSLALKNYLFPFVFLLWLLESVRIHPM